MRAEKLDEGLDIVTGLWNGRPFGYEGRHYRLDEVTFLPTPVQSPRIPIWTTGLWPNERPFLRAARWDGVQPSVRGGGWITTDEMRECIRFVAENRSGGEPFEVAYSGETPGDDAEKAREIVSPWRDAGVTWWMEFVAHWRGSIEEMRLRIRQGPPSL